MTTLTSTSIQVKSLNTPMKVGDRVKFALFFRPLVMVEGEVIEVIAPAGEGKAEWCYRVRYTFKDHTCIDLVDHVDPTLYKIALIS